MKIQSEYQTLRSLGTMSEGTLITGITVHFISAPDFKIDLTKSPEWFKLVKGAYVPKKGDTFWYVDENMKVQSAALSDDLVNITNKTHEGQKLEAGNFFKEQVDALNSAHALKEMLKLRQEAIVQESLKPKADNAAPALGGGLK